MDRATVCSLRVQHGNTAVHDVQATASAGACKLPSCVKLQLLLGFKLSPR
jgi:hypothetical protein